MHCAFMTDVYDCAFGSKLSHHAYLHSRLVLSMATSTPPRFVGAKKQYCRELHNDLFKKWIAYGPLNDYKFKVVGTNMNSTNQFE